MDEQKIVDYIKKNWDNIPDKFKVDIRPDKYSNLKDVKLEGHIVVLLISRQKPSVIPDYSFDEERIGINKFGEIIYGFDSGCSCPSPWFDSYPDCYNVAKSWKEFKVEGFDTDYLDEINKNFEILRNEIKGD